MFGGADEAIARVRADVVRARERAQRLSELRARTASVRGAAVSRRGLIDTAADVLGEDDPVVGSLEATLAPPSRPGSGETGIRW